MPGIRSCHWSNLRRSRAVRRSQSPHLLKGLTDGVLDPENETILRGIANLAPGDFKTVRDRFTFYPKKGLTPEILIEALKNEADVKKVFNKGSSIGF